MVHGLFTIMFSISCILLILIILAQKGKGSLGLGALGGGSQMLFGGSGGQDLFQKITWTLGAIFLGGSLILALLKTPDTRLSGYSKEQSPPIEQKKYR